MFNKLSNKELVTVTHELAKTLGADTTLLDIAKLLAESAMRLDIAVVRGNELQKKLDAAAEENVVLFIKNDELYHFIREYCWVQDGPPDNCDSYVPAENSEMIPETGYASKNESYLNAVRADALREFARVADEKAEVFYSSARASNDFSEDQRFRFAAAMFRGFARQLRSAQLRADAAKDGE